MKISPSLSTIFFLLMFFQGISTPACANDFSISMQEEDKNEIPEYLYKILSLEEWDKSLTQTSLVLAKKIDKGFIHLATEDQLEKVLKKYWSNDPEYVILKVATKDLFGKLIYESNPGGTNKYYHLYEGSIPLHAVVEFKIIYANLSLAEIQTES